VALFYPRDPVVASDVLDLDVINSAMQDAQSEISGELNEHNFSTFALEDAVDPNTGLLPQVDHVEMDFALAIHHTSSSADPYGGPFELVRKSTSWSPIVGSTLEFDTTGGNVHIVASWQMNHTIAYSLDPGLMYAFEVDGNVLPDAMTGSGDIGNDMVNFGISFTLFDGAFGVSTGPGIIADKIGLALELITHMAPGRHVVRLMSKCLNASEDTGQFHTSTSVSIYAVDLRDR
jgi:hypothetical protein